jgi:hypothetical protein
MITPKFGYKTKIPKKKVKTLCYEVREKHSKNRYFAIKCVAKKKKKK